MSSSSYGGVQYLYKQLQAYRMKMKWWRMSCFNGHDGHTQKWAMLDRALMNIHFMNQFPFASLEYLARRISNHKLLLMHISNKYVQ